MILDTCAVLWLASGSSKISRKTLDRINREPAIYVSAITSFEIALKTANGKLSLPLPVRDWFDQVVEKHGLSIISLDPKICIEAAHLPPNHDDPCDRFIVSTAKINGWIVVTADERFESYGVEVCC